MAKYENRFMDVDYTTDGEGALVSYGGFKVTDVNGVALATFASNDVFADCAAMKRWVRENPVSGVYLYQSSIDHLVMDVDGLGWGKDERGMEVIVPFESMKPDAATPLTP